MRKIGRSEGEETLREIKDGKRKCVPVRIESVTQACLSVVTGTP